GTVEVTVSKPGFTDASAAVTGSALDAALAPTFGIPTRTADGYTVQLTNYDPAFTWDVAASTGTASLSSSGLVTVTGLEPGAAASVTVGTAREGHAPGGADISGTALNA